MERSLSATHRRGVEFAGQHFGEEANAPYEGRQLNISVVTKEATEALATVQKSLNAAREEFKNFKWRL
ncbi:hypothetical protein E6C27_scaffold274G006280 [Cucumis melo var. makuwa]|uniref:Uncharacterized protein n=1 Tax=Cucumis melo var. makuwa TaxID=1194695 RepID=A0A5A7USY7_CUCMM|nr:hypothetical protein E6C27_scaffold274G006280 [Cucumis melo var. makuwa]